MAKSQPLFQNRGDCGLFSDDMATLTLFLLVLFNPVASWAVRPTPGVPALTSRASVSLSFVFLPLTAASCQPPRTFSRSSRSQSGSSEHTGVPEFCEMLGSARPRLTDSVCCLKGTGPWSARSPVQVAIGS